VKNHDSRFRFNSSKLSTGQTEPGLGLGSITCLTWLSHWLTGQWKCDRNSRGLC